MHTPPGFTPSHRLPADLPGSTLAFAFAGARLIDPVADRRRLLRAADDAVEVDLAGQRVAQRPGDEQAEAVGQA